MVFDSMKKKILTIKLISYIIINFLRLRDLHSKIVSSNLLNKLTLIKDLSKVSYDILTFNVISLLMNSVPLYFKIKKYYKKIFCRTV